jgi:hypothetical protein
MAVRIGTEAGRRARAWRSFDEATVVQRLEVSALRSLDPSKLAWVAGQRAKAEEYVRTVATALGLDPAEAMRRFLER